MSRFFPLGGGGKGLQSRTGPAFADNPAIHGVVITSSTLIPNFSWTPRMIMSVGTIGELIDQNSPEAWQAHGSPVILVPLMVTQLNPNPLPATLE